jgi:hypothetical protein
MSTPLRLKDNQIMIKRLRPTGKGYPPFISGMNTSSMHRIAKTDAAAHARKHPFKVKPGETELTACKRWIRDLLAHGAVYNGDVLQLAHAAGIDYALLNRAKKALGIRFENRNPGRLGCWRLWFWTLPQNEAHDVRFLDDQDDELDDEDEEEEEDEDDDDDDDEDRGIYVDE